MEPKNKDHINKSDMKKNKLELIKSLSLILSTIIISITGTLLTYRYNSNQLEINKNKELSILIPKLRSTNYNDKINAIIGLSLYGKDAVLPLMSIWAENEEKVIDMEVLNSILCIGKVSIPELVSVYNNPYEEVNKRRWALITLVRMNYKDSKKLIKEAIFEKNFEIEIIESAIMTAGYIGYKDMLPRIIQIGKEFRNLDNYSWIMESVAYSLKLLGGDEAKAEIIKLLNYENHEVQIEAINSLMELADSNDITILKNMLSTNQDEAIRMKLEYAIKAIEIRCNLSE